MDISRLDLPPPSEWRFFEDLCHRLFREEWNCPDIQKHGRPGQDQTGVDLYGIPKGETTYRGVQCKVKSRQGTGAAQLTIEEIKKEARLAKAFEPKFAQLIVATTAPSDAGLQKQVRALNKERAKDDFPIEVFSWQELLLRMGRYPDTVDWYVGPGIGQPRPRLRLTVDSTNRELPAARNAKEDVRQRIEDIRKQIEDVGSIEKQCGSTDGTANDLVSLHRVQTFAARYVPIILSVTNDGGAPAVEIDVDLFISKNYAVSLSKKDGTPLSVLVPSWQDQENKSDLFKLVKLICATPWYPQTLPKDEIQSDAVLWRLGKKTNDLQWHFTSRLPRLKHGTSIDFSRVYVTFAYSAAKDIKIEYRILCDNVRFVEEGAIAVRVTDC